MELRHLRYFVAIAEEGSFTQAAERRLHTAQPSLSRQIRDLELELGVDLFVRGVRGLDLTPSGQVLLDQSRLILSQVAAATEAVRRAARPAKIPFTVGFLTGHEIGWLPKVLAGLGEELQRIELVIHSASSPQLLRALGCGAIDVAFVRPDPAARGLVFRPLIEEQLFVLLPADHRLAASEAIRPEELAAEAFISFPTSYSPALRRVIDEYFQREGITIRPSHEAETLPMVISLALSTGGVTLLPAYMAPLLPPLVVSRPLAGEAPTITLALAYSETNRSEILRRFLSQATAPA
jgi:LysR family hca operon transcriptional activator